MTHAYNSLMAGQSRIDACCVDGGLAGMAWLWCELVSVWWLVMLVWMGKVQWQGGRNDDSWV